MTSRLLITLFFLTFPVLAVFVGAEEPPGQTEEDKKVYRKFHPDGVVEFSDQPSRGSEQLKMEELPTYKFAQPQPAAPAKQPTPQAKQAPGTDAAATNIYSKLSISKPARNETIRSNSGDIEVMITLSPALQFYKGHKLEYLLDGKSILKAEQPQSLKNLDRGTHTLIVQVVDAENRVLIHSDSVTFHVMRYFKPAPKAGSN